MGYTHYWDRPQGIAAETFNAVAQDSKDFYHFSRGQECNS